MSRRDLQSSWQRHGARLLTVASLLTLPALGVTGMDGRAEAAAADTSDLCLSDVLCRAHYKRARTLSHDGEYQAALEAYQTAYRRRGASWLLLNIGRTLHKLGRPSDALGYYNQYKENEPHPAPELEARLSEYIKEVQEELAPVPPATDGPPTTTEPAPPALSRPPPLLVTPMTPEAPAAPLLRPAGEALPGTTQSDRDSGARPTLVRSKPRGIVAGSVLSALGLVGIATGLGFYEKVLEDRSQLSLTGDEFDKLALLHQAQPLQVGSAIGFSIGAALLATGAGILGYSAYKARHRHAERPRIALLTQDHRYMLGLTGVY